jgi:hypothetical protein
MSSSMRAVAGYVEGPDRSGFVVAICSPRAGKRCWRSSHSRPFEALGCRAFTQGPDPDRPHGSGRLREVPYLTGASLECSSGSVLPPPA